MGRNIVSQSNQKIIIIGDYKIEKYVKAFYVC